jgi:outer membrane protein OmpU
MKAALLATSALALLASAASAEITLSGSARMGLTYFDDGTNSATAFSSRVRIGFTASGETDSGLTFGASMRADQDGGNTDGTNNNDSTVYIAGAFGRLTMGDANGAVDTLVGQVSGVGYGPNDAWQELAVVGSHKTAVYYEYSDGALTFGLGSGQLIDGDRTYSLGAKYAANGYSVALGWETDSFVGVKQISISGSAVFGPATVKARISDSNVTDADRTYALSVDYVTGATTLTAFYANFGNTLVDTDFPDFFLSEDTQHIGIGASYDLGGGARVAGGVVRQNNDDAEDDQTFADVGLKFSF